MDNIPSFPIRGCHRVDGGNLLVDDRVGDHMIFLVDVDAKGQAADIMNNNAVVAVHVRPHKLRTRMG